MFFSRLSFSALLAVPIMLSFIVLGVSSAPLDLTRRQVGDIQCNVNRLQTVSGLSQTISAVNDLASSGSADPSVTNATTTALSGLNSAQSGISTIAKALLTGQTAPADARDQVGQGLSTAQTALSGVNSTDTTVTAALTKAQSALARRRPAGQGVVSNCN
ncbi:hypothetical protein DFH11DRAFT_1737484 [Phellopilus nigrolimitatus]|nr:hypothetical protein DFH11DRAFT_1737484 [Phellopilus nigrolimitatus]